MLVGIFEKGFVLEEILQANDGLGAEIGIVFVEMDECFCEL